MGPEAAATLLERASSINPHLKLTQAARRVLVDEAARLRDEPKVDPAIFDAALALVEGANDFRDSRELESYFHIAIRCDAELAERIVESLLRALEADHDKALSRANVLSFLTSPGGTGLGPAFVALRAREPRLIAMVRDHLDGEPHPADAVFGHVTSRRSLTPEEPRDIHRLFEQYALASNVNERRRRSNVTSFPDSYHPGADDDVDAIDPLSTLVIECSRVAATETANGNPDGAPGFALCRQALFELANFEPARIAHVPARLAEALSDDQLLVLAGSLLNSVGNRNFQRFQKTGNDALLLGPLSDLTVTEPGQVALRRLLLKLGHLTLEEIPEKERPEIPQALPRSLAEAEKLRAKLKVERPSKRERDDDAELPAPIAELLEHGQLAALLRVESLRGLADDLTDTLANHREELDEASIEAGLRLEDGRGELHGFLPTEGLTPFATTYSGDYLTLSEAAVSPDGEWAVFRVHHGAAYTASLEALSIGELAARAVVADWAQREFLRDLVTDLLREPAVPEWLAQPAP